MVRNTFLFMLLVWFVSTPGRALDNPTDTLQHTKGGPSSFEGFMPDGIELNTELLPHSNVTVKDKLLELGASCHKGHLVDRNGKQIRIIYKRNSGINRVYTPEQRLAQRKDLELLESKFTVIWILRIGR